MQVADRMSRLGTETAFEVLMRARKLEAEGREIVHLEIGEPDFDTPKHVVEAAQKALAEGWTHYGPAAGLPKLREAIAEEIERESGSLLRTVALTTALFAAYHIYQGPRGVVHSAAVGLVYARALPTRRPIS